MKIITRERIIGWLIFVVVGIQLMIIGKSPIELKIIHSDTGSMAQIHRISYLLPFKNIDISIPQLKCAVIEKSKNIKGGTIYIVKLESHDGTKTSIAPLFYSSYIDSENCMGLQDQINGSIETKTDFKYIIEQSVWFIVGIFVLILSFCNFIPHKDELDNEEDRRKVKRFFLYIGVFLCIAFFVYMIYSISTIKLTF